MYTITAYTHCGKTWEKTVIDDEYALALMLIACKAADARLVMLTDATTGEVLAEYTRGKIEVF